ncbi:hypothetical protein GTY54_49550, partial [Streptomyces sp. SID625]|nr:hypothetical protein [Streptomyces sp. SID625]
MIGQVIADDGVRLQASRTGRGAAPLVLCHGGPGLWGMFGDVAALLADRADVVRWDQRARAWGTPERVAACRGLDVPVVIVDGGRDIRPRAAVDSLAAALPRVRRTVLPGAGHLPWVEEPA